MDILWAGWRSEYVRSAGAAALDGDCLFCALAGADDRTALILARARYAFVVMNRYPYTTGHVMVSPYRHVAGMSDLTEEEAAEMWGLLGRCEDVASRVLQPDGFNLGANLGRAAGAGVPGHLHLHLVPRWAGDTNFMSAVGDTRVVPEALEVTWQRLRSGFAGDAADG